jgi:hypothetical protein
VVLHHGRHHLAQYMYMRLHSDKKTPLTQRANRQLLLKVSKQIFTELKKYQPDSTTIHRNRATRLNRMVWLSQFFSSALPEFPHKKPVPIFSFVTGLVVATVLGLQIVEAIEYHPTYLKRIKNMDKKIQEYQEMKEKRDGATR